MLTLKELIEYRGLNQQQLASKMGWMPYRVSRYVRAKRAIPPAAAARISKVLKALPVLVKGATPKAEPIFRYRPLETCDVPTKA